MTGYFQVEISAYQITEAMNQDGGFALEVWRDLAEKLHMGLLLDNAVDLAANIDPRDARFIAGQFRELAEAIQDQATNGN